jgi:hypothetical protein
LLCQFKLLFEARTLCVPVTGVHRVLEIEAHLTQRHDARMGQARPDPAQIVRRHVRMLAHGCPHVRMLVGYRQDLVNSSLVNADAEETANAGCAGTRQGGIRIVQEIQVAV